MSMIETTYAGNPAYTETLPRLPESACRARHLVTSALVIWGLEEAEDAAVLVMSELVSNAVAHARRDLIRVTVTRQGPRHVQVSVVDHSQLAPKPRPAGDGDEDGRGLALIAALTDGRWGVDPLRWGKRVWADLVAPPAPKGLS
ncbi:ATP-binding protein [Streptomyces sp. A5-4]|uniref:ATP-binding protein n=1 Tax=Streptomyces sp. A5-4 TaxID=3384771 RepID=UPI003DA90F92